MAQGAFAQAIAYTEVDFIAGRYPPDQLVLAGPGRRLAGALLDQALIALALTAALVTLASAAFSPRNAPILLLLSVVFLFGWLAWFVVVAPNGQTPGKQLLGMYVIKADATRAGGVYMWLRELLIKNLFGSVLSFVTLGIYPLLAALWCLWDKNHQCLWDKLASTYVAYSPFGFRPLTAAEMGLRGETPPHPSTPATIGRIGSMGAHGVTRTEWHGQTATQPAALSSRIGVLEAGRAAPAVSVVAGQSLVVGRDARAQIHLNDPKASRRHLEVRLEADGWVVRDLGATNPASIMSSDGRRPMARNSSTRLRSGQLSIGESVITLYPVGR